MMKSLVCSSVLITGCNRGIGLAFVKHILKLPVVPKHIFATCRSLKADNARELTELAEKNSNLHLLELDVRDVSTQRLPEMVEKVEAVLAGSGLNLLINNAGITTNETSWHDVTVDAMKSSYEVNTIAPLMITKAFLPLLKRAGSVKEPSSQPQAAVVNISTIMASIQLHQSQGVQMKLPYRTTKAALNMVTKSLSLDLIKDGIIVVSIHPGWVQTNMGTQKASLTTSESVASMLNVIGSLDTTKNGCFLNYDGTTLPW